MGVKVELAKGVAVGMASGIGEGVAVDTASGIGEAVAVGQAFDVGCGVTTIAGGGEDAQPASSNVKQITTVRVLFFILAPSDFVLT